MGSVHSSNSGDRPNGGEDVDGAYVRGRWLHSRAEESARALLDQPAEQGLHGM